MNGVIAAARRRCNPSSWNSTTGNTSESNACSDAVRNIERFHSGSNSDPRDGDIVYSDDSCTRFDGQDKWFAPSTPATAFQIDSVGVVSNRNICI